MTEDKKRLVVSLHLDKELYKKLKSDCEAQTLEMYCEVKIPALIRRILRKHYSEKSVDKQ